MLSELLKVQLNSDLIGPFLLYSYNYRGMLTTIYDKTRVDDGEIYWLEGFETIRATGAYTFTLPAERGKEIHLLFSKINTGTFFRKVVFWEQWQKKHKSPWRKK